MSEAAASDHEIEVDPDAIEEADDVAFAPVGQPTWRITESESAEGKLRYRLRVARKTGRIPAWQILHAFSEEDIPEGESPESYSRGFASSPGHYRVEVINARSKKIVQDESGVDRIHSFWITEVGPEKVDPAITEVARIDAEIARIEAEAKRVEAQSRLDRMKREAEPPKPRAPSLEERMDRLDEIERKIERLTNGVRPTGSTILDALKNVPDWLAPVLTAVVQRFITPPDASKIQQAMMDSMVGSMAKMGEIQMNAMQRGWSGLTAAIIDNWRSEREPPEESDDIDKWVGRAERFMKIKDQFGDWMRGAASPTEPAADQAKIAEPHERSYEDEFFRALCVLIADTRPASVAAAAVMKAVKESEHARRVIGALRLLQSAVQKMSIEDAKSAEKLIEPLTGADTRALLRGALSAAEGRTRFAAIMSSIDDTLKAASKRPAPTPPAAAPPQAASPPAAAGGEDDDEESETPEEDDDEEEDDMDDDIDDDLADDTDGPEGTHGAG